MSRWSGTSGFHPYLRFVFISSFSPFLLTSAALAWRLHLRDNAPAIAGFRQAVRLRCGFRLCYLERTGWGFL